MLPASIERTPNHIVMLFELLTWLNVTFYIFQITFLQIVLKISMISSITFVLAGVSLLYLCVFIFFNFSFLFYFTSVYVFVCLEHDFYNNNNTLLVHITLMIWQ